MKILVSSTKYKIFNHSRKKKRHVIANKNSEEKMGEGINKNNRNKIVIPKKIVKKACCRNKIRRQIRAILHEMGIKNHLVKYKENNSKPKFSELKETVIEKMKCITSGRHKELLS